MIPEGLLYYVREYITYYVLIIKTENEKEKELLPSNVMNRDSTLCTDNLSDSTVQFAFLMIFVY